MDEAEFIQRWWQYSAINPVSAAELVGLASRDPPIMQCAIGSGNARSKAVNMAKFLADLAKARLWVNGKRVCVTRDRHRKAKAYCLEATKEKTNREISPLTPEQLTSEEQRIRNEAQDRVLGEMARKGIKLEQFEAFDMLWHKLKAEYVAGRPTKKAIETLEAMNELVLALRRRVSALARVSRGEGNVSMEDIATAGLMLDCRWDIKGATNER